MNRGLWHAYRLRWKRRRFLFRIWRKRAEIRAVRNRTDQITPGAILAFSTMRNEMLRLPYFLEHYRKLGINHFLIVDNASDDGTAEYLASQPDVSLWTTAHRYRLSRFGMDWLGWLQCRYGDGHWCLTVDADELLVYPDYDQRGLAALTRWLSVQGRSSFGAMMLDLYPKGPIDQVPYKAGDDPLQTVQWFDGAGYRHRWHPYYGNLWIQGGVRDRVFFGDDPARAPTLNKTPLVHWSWRYAYVSSTHQLLPTRLHDTFDPVDQAKATGVLLHTKFLPDSPARSREELQRQQHFANSTLYHDYHQSLTKGPDLWYPDAYRYEGPAQLMRLGLMAGGDWAGKDD